MSLEKYCCSSIGTHDTICSSEKRKGGISGVAILKKEQVSITDYENAAQWATAIANGDAIIITKISGEYPEVSEIETERVIGCGNETELDGFNHVFSWQDAAVNQANNEFYQDLNGCTYHLVIFDCQPNGTDKIHVVDEVDVNFVCKPAVIEKGTSTVQKYMCSAKWTSNFDQFMTQYDAPAGIFET
jgi:hypothetical protein